MIPSNYIQITNLKLSSIPLVELKRLARSLNIPTNHSSVKIIKSILNVNPTSEKIDSFIKNLFLEKIQQRRNRISDEELKLELKKVKHFSWGVIQGNLDQKVQTEYVRKFIKYEEVINAVKNKLHNDVTNYVICSWFNHWTTVLIEEHIGLHPKVVPTIKNIKGIDLFFENQPFDLKVTYLPKNFDPETAINNPKELAVWMYENQGAQRFGSDNRIFIILLDRNEPEKSWELKRDFELVFNKIDQFFNQEKVTKDDEIVFSFKRKTYSALTKVLIITK